MADDPGGPGRPGRQRSRLALRRRARPGSSIVADPPAGTDRILHDEDLVLLPVRVDLLKQELERQEVGVSVGGAVVAIVQALYSLRNASV